MRDSQKFTVAPWGDAYFTEGLLWLALWLVLAHELEHWWPDRASSFCQALSFLSVMTTSSDPARGYSVTLVSQWTQEGAEPWVSPSEYLYGEREGSLCCNKLWDLGTICYCSLADPVRLSHSRKCLCCTTKMETHRVSIPECHMCVPVCAACVHKTKYVSPELVIFLQAWGLLDDTWNSHEWTFYENLYSSPAKELPLPLPTKSVKTQWLSLRLCSVLFEYELIPHGFIRNFKMNGTNYSPYFLHHTPAEMGLSRLQIPLEGG